MEAAPPQPAASIRDMPPAVAEREIEGAMERERWFRSQYEREHQVTLSVMRILLGGVHHPEGDSMNFWRWLIDDLRSERRKKEALKADFHLDPRVEAVFGPRP